MAESRPPIVVGIRQTSSDTSTNTVCGALEYIANGCSVDHGEQKDDREASEQNVQRDLVRSLMPLRSFHQRDHAIKKGFAWIRT